MTQNKVSGFGDGKGVLGQAHLSVEEQKIVDSMSAEQRQVVTRLAQHPHDEPRPTHEIASDDYKQVVADLKKISQQLMESKITWAEADERTERAMKELAIAQTKNIPVPPAAPPMVLAGGYPGIPLSWNRAMSMRTSDSQLLGFQKLETDVSTRALLLALKAGLLTPGIPISLENINRYVPLAIYKQAEDFAELQHVRKLAAGSFIDTVTATSGIEWTPTGFARMAVDFPFVDSDFLPLLEQVLIPDGVGAFSVPIEISRAQSQLVGQQTGVQTAFIRSTGIKTPLTDTWDFAPKVQELGYQWSMEANMDLAVDMLQRAIRQTQAGVARGIRQCAINGQEASDATLDGAPATSGLESANGWSAAFGGKGFRLHCVENAYTTSLGGSKATFTDILNGRGNMGKFGNDPKELLIITSPKGHIGMLADTNVRTVDVLGTNATILRGMLASVGGASLFADSEFPETLATSGLAAGTGTTTGTTIVNRTRWANANKRSVETVVIPGIGTYTMTVISRARADTGVAVPGVSIGLGEKSAWYLINQG